MKLIKSEVPKIADLSPGPEKEKIHIGLVLAGAVTAGAYTAGVLDYLLNTLDLWQEEYDKDDPNNRKVAEPNVIIDTITGASAGSIVAAVTLLAMTTRRYENVVDADQQVPGKNLLFDTWVNLGLKPGESMTDKLFSDSDLKDGVKSILNTDWISDLMKNLVEQWGSMDKHPLPKYINEELKVLMTLSNLRGVPLELSFSSGSGAIAHTMSYHKAFAYFKLNKKQQDQDKTTFPLDLKHQQHVEFLLECARASGAFPIGLKSVKFEDKVPREYIEENLREIFKGARINASIEDPYDFLAVDGGMTNNEPIAEALRILNAKHDSPSLEDKVNKILTDGHELRLSADQQIGLITKAVQTEKQANKPIIMIDPFPNYSFPEKKDSAEPEERKTDAGEYLNDSLLQVIPKLYKTLRNQVLFKESDIGDLFNNDSQKGMIWPTRSINSDNYRNAIASAALDGFAGFFRTEFLKHDYMLGQKNCRSFLRQYFYTDYEQSVWPPDMKEKFVFTSEDGKRSLPIIPDYRKPPKDVPEDEILVGRFPQVDFHELITNDLRPKIEKRVSAVLEILVDDSIRSLLNPKDIAPGKLSAGKPAVHGMAAPDGEAKRHPWLITAKKKDSGFLSVLRRMVIKFIIREARKTIKRELSIWITNQIILELSKHGLFRDDPQPTDNIMR